MDNLDIYKIIDKCSEGRWKRAEHLDRIIELLLKIESRETRFAIVNMPPRHGKSQLISVYFPVWYMLKNPNHKIIITSYNSSFSSQFGTEILDILENNDFGIKLSKRNKSKNYIKIDGTSGSLSFVGAGASLTGKGADLLIIDDPFKNNTEAESFVIQEKIWNWFLTTAYTRLEKDGVLIIVMTRWHKEDLCGKIIKKFKLDGGG